MAYVGGEKAVMDIPKVMIKIAFLSVSCLILMQMHVVDLCRTRTE